MSTGDWDLFRACGKWRGFSPGAAARPSQSARAHVDFRIKQFIFQKNRIEPLQSPPELIRVFPNSTLLARGGSEAKAPALAARPVPWNGQGRRLVE